MLEVSLGELSGITTVENGEGRAQLCIQMPHFPLLKVNMKYSEGNKDLGEKICLMKTVFKSE